MKRIINAFSKLNSGTAYAVLALCAATAIALPAQDQPEITGINLLDSFAGGINGASPEAGLVQGPNGNLYGTTSAGGANLYGLTGSGIVFEMTPSGKLTTIYNFCSVAPCDDGANPDAPLVLGADGDFYGTTSARGSYAGGTVFKITPSGTLTTLYSFCHLANCADGSNPHGPLVQASNGNFYGTTQNGGLSYGDTDCYLGCGTVFEITPSGTLTTLYSFCQQFECPDGSYPAAGLVEDSNRYLYGTTTGGSTSGIDYVYGTIFKMSLTGALTTMYTFCSAPNCTDGNSPNAGLTLASNGWLYGTTYAGGTNQLNGGYGTVFRIASGSGKLTTLYSFCAQSGCTDGANPESLVQASNGNLYGMTRYGGAANDGTIFEITPGGTLTTLDSFDFTDGALPTAGLVQDTSGTLYGTASEGGAGTLGTVFSLSISQGAFVETVPGLGAVGSTVKILGSFPKGATSVTFNGTPATFTNVSAYELSATVPTGAESGTVEVVTPGGTLSSYPPFQVLP